MKSTGFFPFLNLRLKLILSGVTAVGFTLLVLAYRLPVQSVVLTDTGSASVTASNFSFPYIGESGAGNVFVFGMTVRRSLWCPAWIKIIPDDELLAIRVNGSALPLTNIRPGALFDWNNGFSYPLGYFLRSGDNTVEIEIRNNGGKFGLSVSHSPRDPVSVALFACFASAFLVFSYFLLRALKRSPVWIAVILGALAVRLIYLAVTPWSLRGHDATGHLDYIEFIIRNLALPSSSQGFEFYHPPLYYLLTAALAGFLEFLQTGRAWIYRVLQFFSLALNMVFVAVSLATLEEWLRTWHTGLDGVRQTGVRFIRTRPGGLTRVIRDGKILRTDLILLLAGGLFALWPSGIIHSVRIGNDALLYPLFAAGIYYLQRWTHRGEDRDLYRSAVAASLAVMTKTNAVVLVGLMAFVILMQWWGLTGRFRPAVIREWLRKAILAGSICLAGLAVAFVPRMIEAARGENQNLLVANVVSLDPSLKVGNHLSNYIWFNAREFVTVPYTSPWEDGRGRQLFWNYLLKTALFGEFSYDTLFLRYVGILISLLFILILVYSAAFPFLARPADLSGGRVLIWEAVFLAAAAVVFRILIPSSSSNDFRYILPVLLPGTAIFGYTVFAYARRGFLRMSRAGIVLAALFAAFVVFFFLGLVIFHTAS